MHHRKTYMYINFQQNRVSRLVKTVYTNLFAKICKLHKFATCNQNFEKSRFQTWSIHYPLPDSQAKVEINRPDGYQITAKRNYFYRWQSDRPTFRWTNIQADFEINRLIRYQITAKRSYFHRRQTDRRRGRQQ